MKYFPNLIDEMRRTRVYLEKLRQKTFTDDEFDHLDELRFEAMHLMTTAKEVLDKGEPK